MAALFSVFLNATFYGSVMILLTLVLRPFLRKAPRCILCFLWLFVMVRLLLPISIESKLSLQPRFFPVQPIVSQVPEIPYIPPVQAPVSPSTVPEVTLPAVTPVIPSPEIATLPDVSTSAQSALKLMDILPIVWFSVMCIIFVYMAVSYSLLRHRLRDAVPCEKRIWESDRIPGAFMLGYLWPQIYLPTGLNPADRELIIAHEKAHIRRGDTWWKLLGMFCLCIHWYNPLVWLAYILMSRDIETACDEQVVRNMPIARRKAYSYALLNSGKRMSGIFASPVAFSEVNLKHRIKKVLSYRNPGIWITVIGIALCVCSVIFFMPDPVLEQQDISLQNNTQSAQSTESTQDTTEAAVETPEVIDETVHAHNWQAATCTAPKRCSVCGATDGSAKEHTYVNRKCTGCGVLLPTQELRYTLSRDNRSYLCEQYSGSDPYIVIPATYNGRPVTTIGPLCSNTFTQIALPSSVTTIADWAFIFITAHPI